MRAIQISSFGNPTDVLELIDIPEPPQPDAGQALIAVEFAPINHNDLLLIKGTFHWTPSLPYVVGNGRDPFKYPDFRFSRDGPNLLMLSDAFIHKGSEVGNTPRRTYTQWVKSKTGRFSSVSTDF